MSLAGLFDWTGDDVELRRRAQVLGALGFMSSVVGLGSMAARLLLHGLGVDVLMSAVMVVIGLLCPFIARSSRSVVIPSLVLLMPGIGLAAFVGHAEGGLTSPATLFLPVIPLVATFLLGWRGGAVTLGLVVGALWILIDAPSGPSQAPMHLFAAAAMSGIFVFACSVAFDVSRHGAQRRILRLVEEAEARNVSLQQANEEMGIAHREARAASQLKSEFMTTMSHELRTPLNSVIGFSNVLLKNKAGNLRPSDEQLLGRIRDNGVDLLSLINDILEASRIESGQLELEPVPVELAEVCAEVVEVLEPFALEKGLSLRAEIPEGLGRIEADRRRLGQVLSNLVANAVKFTERGSVSLRVVPETGTGVPSRIEVVDSGIGIPEERLEAVLEPFVQADGTTSKRCGGVGLGLSISRSLCERMGFGLQLRSVQGQGTTVMIELSGCSVRPRGGLGAVTLGAEMDQISPARGGSPTQPGPAPSQCSSSPYTDSATASPLAPPRPSNHAPSALIR